MFLIVNDHKEAAADTMHNLADDCSLMSDTAGCRLLLTILLNVVCLTDPPVSCSPQRSGQVHCPPAQNMKSTGMK